MEDNLKNNHIDLISSAVKSIVGIVPYAGPLLGELVNNIIPNQRIDRLTKYLKELDQKLSNIPLDKINGLVENEDFIDLMEEGFVQASRAISDDRRRYIASIISNGILNDEILLIESKYLLKILQELNDIEIIWLRYHLDSTISGDVEFRKLHSNTLARVEAYMGAEQQILYKAAIQQSYCDHLDRLQLIYQHYKIDRSTGLPEFSRSTGKPKISHIRITTLGELLLNHIGLNSPNPAQ